MAAKHPSLQSLKRILPIDEPVDISREQITLLMMESYKKSSNSAEEIMCLREVAKMNGLYEKESKTTNINLIHVEQNLKKLEVMPDEELLRLAGHNKELFQQHVSTEEPAIEAEYSEVED